MRPDLAEPLHYLQITLVKETNENPHPALWHGRCSLFCPTNQGIPIDAEEVLRMQRDKQAVATLGDLIAAVTDEVSPLTNSPTKTNVLVSYILNDLFVTKRVRFRQGRMAKARFGR